MISANDTARAYENGLRDGKAELDRWKRAAGEYYQAKTRHQDTLDAIRKDLSDPALSDTAKVIRAQGTLAGHVPAERIAETETKWACPKCGADANEHGKGDCLSTQKNCLGFICECEGDQGDEHGTEQELCRQATCYHCGWGGRFPTGLVKCPACKGAGRIKKGAAAPKASAKRKRKLPRRKRQHPAVGSAMAIDRRQAPERRAGDIDGRKEA